MARARMNRTMLLALDSHSFVAKTKSTGAIRANSKKAAARAAKGMNFSRKRTPSTYVCMFVRAAWGAPEILCAP